MTYNCECRRHGLVGSSTPVRTAGLGVRQAGHRTLAQQPTEGGRGELQKSRIQRAHRRRAHVYLVYGKLNGMYFFTKSFNFEFNWILLFKLNVPSASIETPC